ncbi:MAG TPA: 1-phosphofructokinase family hexose kinase [Mariniphaga sp.]|nr:1-phosphofructokinase family hexose kinase [Mariniphaga sp.]
MKVVTLTMNPVVDLSTHAKIVVPTKKTRCGPPVFEPGGGGINVSRALKKLGYDSQAIFLAGGKTGDRLKSLLKNDKIQFKAIKTKENTRENIMVTDEKSGDQYRFIMPGPEIQESEWKEVFKVLDEVTPHPDYIIASGSLPPGVPDDFYARIAEWARNNDVNMVVDTSGPALKLALEKGVYLAKPNLRELGEMIGNENITGMELDEAAREILNRGYAKVLIVSLGAKGALLAQRDNLEYVVPPVMPVVSAVGAGDSMVAGVIYACLKGFWPEKAIRYGVAAGTAATMTPGSELCRKSDTEKIFEWLNVEHDD